MSEEKQDKEILETSPSGDSPSTEKTVAEKDVDSSGSNSSTSSDEVLGKIATLLEKQNETTVNLSNKISEMEAKLNSLNQEMEESKPLEIRATVTGTYDYETKRKEIENQHFLDEKEKARKLFAKIRNDKHRY